MNLAHRWPAALLTLTVCGPLALAQPVQPAAQPGAEAGGQRVRAADSDRPEDVEILRRLLDGAFAEAYGVSVHKPLTSPIRYYPLIGAGQLSDDGRLMLAQHIDSAAPHTEGVFLKDFGVVYTVTLPYPGFDPVSGSKPGAASKPPLDPWERTRKELRGETPQPEGKPLPAHQPLSEVILKVLAENGRHFTSLADGERVAVAVTFRGAASCANCHQNPWDNNGQPLATFRATTYWHEAGQPADLNATPAPPDPNTPRLQYVVDAAIPTPAWQNDVRSDVLLGDLHLKQGKGKEAIEAYAKAMRELEQGIDRKRYAEKGYVPADLPVLLISIDIMNKEAQAFVLAGDDGEAKIVLGRASDLAKKAEALTGGPPATKAPASAALPGKLVVAASKKLLDEVGSGKMTFEAFCKAATVEYTPGAVGAVEPAANDPGTGGK